MISIAFIVTIIFGIFWNLNGSKTKHKVGVIKNRVDAEQEFFQKVKESINDIDIDSRLINIISLLFLKSKKDNSLFIEGIKGSWEQADLGPLFKLSISHSFFLGNVDSEDYFLTNDDINVLFEYGIIGQLSDSNFEGYYILVEVGDLESIINKKLSEINLQIKKFKSFDTNDNGYPDVIEINNLDGFVEKNILKFKDIDLKYKERNYIRDLSKLSEYIKILEDNVILFYSKLKLQIKDNHSSKLSLVEIKLQMDIFEDSHYSYNLHLFYAINLVSSLLDEEMFTFYKLHGIFDKYLIFSTANEKASLRAVENISLVLADISRSLFEISSSLRSVNTNLNNMSKHLENINSNFDVHNTLSIIQSYQIKGIKDRLS